MNTYSWQSADIKAGVKQQEIKEILFVSYNFSQMCPFSKLEIQCKLFMSFYFDIGWNSFQPDIVCYKQVTP